MGSSHLQIELPKDLNPGEVRQLVMVLAGTAKALAMTDLYCVLVAWLGADECGSGNKLASVCSDFSKQLLSDLEAAMYGEGAEAQTVSKLAPQADGLGKEDSHHGEEEERDDG